MPIVLEIDSKEFDAVPEFYRIIWIAEDEISGMVGEQVRQRIEIEGSVWPLHRQFIVLNALDRKSKFQGVRPTRDERIVVKLIRILSVVIPGLTA